MARQSKNREKRKTSAWFRRHVRDAYVRRAKAEGRRSRAAFKLSEILQRHGLRLQPDAVIVDLGCAPGSWSGEIAGKLGPAATVIGIDLLPVEPIAGVALIQADFTSEPGQQALVEALNGRQIDLLLSDMAPEMSGNKIVDQARVMQLNELTLDFAVDHLRPGGSLLLKSFMGEGFASLKKEIGGWFAQVRAVKPAASRKDSSETYLLATGFRTKQVRHSPREV